MRGIILGDTGSGKTLLAIDMLLEYYGKGFKVWSNIPLNNVDYTLVTGTDFIDDVDESEANFVLIDEVGEVSRGLNQFNFGQLMAQSRKSIGENQVFLMTAQVSQQASSTMKGLVDYIIYPTILQRNLEDHNKPTILQADFYRKAPRTSRPIFDYFDTLYYNTTETCDAYNTHELVEALEDGRFKKYLTKYAEYIDSKGRVRELKLILQEKNGLNLAEAERMALKIVNSRAWGLLD